MRSSERPGPQPEDENSGCGLGCAAIGDGCAGCLSYLGAALLFLSTLAVVLS